MVSADAKRQKSGARGGNTAHVARPQSTPQSTEESPYSLSFFWRALRNSWYFGVAGLAVGGAVSLLYSKSLPRAYQASSLVEFVPDVVRPGADGDESARFWGMLIDNREYYETQYALITTNLVLSRVVRELGLQTDPRFLGGVPEAPVSVQDAIDRVRGAVKVDPVKASRLMYIRCEHTEPEVAAQLCDAIANAYVRQNREKLAKGMNEAAESAGRRLERSRAELEESENLLHAYKRDNALPSSSPEEVARMARLDMESYSRALVETRTQKADYLARYAELAKISPENPDQIPASELLNNAYLQQLRKEYQDAVRQRKALLGEGKGDNHPSVKRSDETIGQARKDLVEEIRNIQGSAKRDVAIINQRERNQAGLYEMSHQQAVALNSKELEYHRLERIRARNEERYGVALESLRVADGAKQWNVETVRLVDGAVMPRDPLRPNVPANVGAGLAFGTLLGLLLAILREQLDRSIKAPGDVESFLGATFLGLLPSVADDGELVGRKGKGTPKRVEAPKPRRARAQNEGRELLVHERPLSALAEAARSVRTNLLFMDPDRPPKLLLITSAAPSEGKTTVACSVAITLAQAGQRVCIVDCDLRRPRLHRIFPEPGVGGVTSVLLGEAELDQVARPTVVPNLSCVRSGPIPPNPADVLQSERFRELLRGLSERFDRVILDSPPVAAVADATILSTLVDGCVFVVRAFKTSRVLAQQGLRSLRDIDANVVGVVLNAVDLQREQSYYQYYYYKREGYLPRPGEDGVDA